MADLPIDPRRGDRAETGPLQGQPSLQPYHDLINLTDVRSWTPHLDYDYEASRWTLCIRHRSKIIAKATSTLEAPEAFLELATALMDTLERMRRFG